MVALGLALAFALIAKATDPADSAAAG